MTDDNSANWVRHSASRENQTFVSGFARASMSELKVRASAGVMMFSNAIIDWLSWFTVFAEDHRRRKTSLAANVIGQFSLNFTE